MGARRFSASRAITADIEPRSRAAAARAGRAPRGARGRRGAASSALATASHKTAQPLDILIDSEEKIAAGTQLGLVDRCTSERLHCISTGRYK